MSEPKEYVRHFVKGGANVFVALIVAGIIGLVLRMFLTRAFNVEDYGLFFWAFYFVTFFFLFPDFGFNTALTKFIPEFMLKKQLGRVKSSMVAVMLIQALLATPITIVLFIFSDQIALATFGTPSVSIVIKILSIWFFVMVFFHAFRSTFRGLQDMATFAAMEVFYILTVFVFTICLVQFFYRGIESVGFAYLLGAMVLVILWFVAFHFRHRNILREKVRIEKPLIKKMGTFAFPLFVASIGGIILSYIGTILLGILRTPAEVAHYQTALPLTYLISYPFSAIVAVFLPFTSELWARGEKKYLTWTIHFVVKFSFMLVIPVTLIFMLLPEITLSSIFTAEYLPGATALQILSAAVIISGLFVIFEKCVAPGIGKTTVVTKVVLAMASINIIANLLLIPWYGTVGAAIAMLISNLVGLALVVYLLRRFIEFVLPTSSLLKTLVAGGVMLLLAFILKSIVVLPPWWLEAIVVAIPSLLCYVALIVGMGAIRRRDLTLLKETLPISKKLVKVAERVVKE